MIQEKQPIFNEKFVNFAFFSVFPKFNAIFSIHFFLNFCVKIYEKFPRIQNFTEIAPLKYSFRGMKNCIDFFSFS